MNRRELLKATSSGVPFLAFAALADAESKQVSAGPLAPKKPHFPASAKRVIFLSMRGAPSHVDMFDHKPQLAKDNGKAGRGGRGGAKLLGSPWEFKQQGKGGLWISELLPELGKQADDLCLLRGMHTDIPNHPQAQTQMHTGNFQFVRPSLGAWTVYGLGTENADLPGFVAIGAGAGTASHFGSSFLPAIYQGSRFGGTQRRAGGNRRGRGDQAPAIPNIKNQRLTKDQQRMQLDYVQGLNKAKLARDGHAPGVEGVIESFELGYRMQDTLPELMDFKGESKSTLDLYGIGTIGNDNFAKQCLLARRASEAGVRFVEISHGNWDHHRNLANDLPARCSEIDQPIAGLLADLKQRDMLKDTLVVWSGEFGRTPHGQGGDGRDHNAKGYTSWMAGGGVKGGFSYGATDDHGYEAIDGRMHTHDWHATILHLLGLDHERLTYRHAGRDFRLTDVHGNVAKEILA